MKRLAIDIVIVPPDPVIDLAIEWNLHLSKKRPQPILLGKATRLPHISLLMGCLSFDRIGSAQSILKDIADHTCALDLEITGPKVVEGGTTPVVTLDIGLTPTLLSLHESILTAFKPILTQDAIETEIDDSGPISSSSIQWVNNFMMDQCNENFWPHITVGHGESDQKQGSYNFRATRIAMFHLGNHCTCKRLLFEVELTK